MRLGLSGLNSHRKRFHFINDSACLHCHCKKEDPTHFLIQCAGHAAHRVDLMGQLGLLPQCNHLLINLATKKSQKELCKVLLYGIGEKNIDVRIFEIVAAFIEKTKRFEYRV